jgi:hypothetical protein
MKKGRKIKKTNGQNGLKRGKGKGKENEKQKHREKLW